MHFFDREGVVDDVLGEALEILTTRGSDPAAPMDIESGVPESGAKLVRA